MKKVLLFIVFFAACYLLGDKPCYGQSKDSSKFWLSGYVDAYCAYYTDSVGPGKYQKFPAISPRSNSFGVNIAQLTENYSSDRIRSTATLQFGDLPSAAWSPIFNYIQEANVGFRIAKKFWIDGGFFKTHIGTESLLPKDNIASSISVITFYEPWWQSGLKFSYTPSDKFQMAIFVENGYNEFVSTNENKALGMLFIYNIGDKGSLGYYNFLGDMAPFNASVSKIRLLNNLVFSYQFGGKLKMILGMDYITQQNSSLSNASAPATVLSAIATFKYQCIKKFGIYGRYEEFSDPDGILSGLFQAPFNSVVGYQLLGVTLGAEYKPTENSYIRLEGRMLNSHNALTPFYTDGNYVTNREEVMLNVGIWF